MVWRTTGTSATLHLLHRLGGQQKDENRQRIVVRQRHPACPRRSQRLARAATAEVVVVVVGPERWAPVRRAGSEQSGQLEQSRLRRLAWGLAGGAGARPGPGGVGAAAAAAGGGGPPLARPRLGRAGLRRALLGARGPRRGGPGGSGGGAAAGAAGGGVAVSRTARGGAGAGA
eukprot:CAMPEP_0118944738 /NCGR_PEP_ID=MMETSP1169-20130426/40905_1 /TAXON_ID=36882 /ORGANISM="Pyramimonas obovata, Strain CCMP722" /LENGTH=172 /DNA_ID=CAMNT_0006890289 /DNA_START=214 /DNA_END=729 /DNA_ORIENTATION=+